jgi:SAM-dependent methyltransferase
VDLDEHDPVLDPALAIAHDRELREGRRFGFGRNWSRYAESVDAEAVSEAERSLVALLEPSGLTRAGRIDGLRFLDAGCGSGLFSLAALRLGARVVAFDFDPRSVLTTRRLIAENAAPAALESGRFSLLHGSVLDEDFMTGLGDFDVVYSWGVLHHTGAMWEACRRAAGAVRPDGALIVALYHDAGRMSVAWWWVKRLSASLSGPLQTALAGLLLLPIELFALVRSLLRRDPVGYVRRWSRYRSLRGMSRWHDHLDWVGGFPYEWATPDEVIAFHRELGFTHRLTVDAIAWGCNEFTFVRSGVPEDSGPTAGASADR